MERNDFAMKIMNYILIIDDNDEIKDLCHSYLDGCCSEILFAGNAIIGLDLLKKHTIDVVLVEMNIPKTNGFSFVEMAKNKYPNIRFLVMFKDVRCINFYRAINVGVFDFIEKPFVKTNFLEKIEAASKQGEGINRAQLMEHKKMLIAFRDEVLSSFEKAQGNMDVLRFDIEQIFDLKIGTEKKRLNCFLTPTEKDISEMIDGGLNAKAIAREKNRSLNTIQVHIKSIRRKLGLVKNRNEVFEEF